jgi:predicted amidophosphoribosyltransferase
MRFPTCTKHEEIGNVMGIPILWRTTKERYSLQGEICPECERVVFPPRRVCPYCGREAAEGGDHSAEVDSQYEYSFVMPKNVELSAIGDD